MGRRRDRERFLIRKKLDPNYAGFRGYQPKPESKPELKSIACTLCGHKRNVPQDTEEEGFVCATCHSTEAGEAAED